MIDEEVYPPANPKTSRPQQQSEQKYLEFEQDHVLPKLASPEACLFTSTYYTIAALPSPRSNFHLISQQASIFQSITT